VRLVHGAFSTIAEFDDYFTDTSQLFRKLGIHLFPACQYVKKVLSPAVRECLRARIVHLCASVEASKAVLNSDMAVSLDESHDGYFQLGDNVESAIRFTSFHVDDDAINYIVNWCCRQYPAPRQLQSSQAFAELFDGYVDEQANGHTAANQYVTTIDTAPILDDPWRSIAPEPLSQEDEDYALWLKMQRYYRDEKKPTQNGLFRFCFSHQESPTSGASFYGNQAAVERVKAKYGTLQQPVSASVKA
jgi:DNA segregation ATPase FtsK/SpoIIIE-like protein